MLQSKIYQIVVWFLTKIYERVEWAERRQKETNYQ